MTTSRRQKRVADLLMEELGAMIALELEDPRLQFVSVTAVEVSPDLRHARVYVTHLGTPEEEPSVLEALHHASGYLRRELARRVVLRYVPELSFRMDDTLERARRIDQLIERLHADEVESD
ncbi:MAG: 30S ribosome-binding factor RbfA [Anaerolineae bacterium]|nr:30S ribosome-binding factor RbfA [Anaerolineae bacterium]MDW8100323.1 30S ribosome-binding factor RbfA [Anaerolineae bacterium]